MLVIDKIIKLLKIDFLYTKAKYDTVGLYLILEYSHGRYKNKFYFEKKILFMRMYFCVPSMQHAILQFCL